MSVFRFGRTLFDPIIHRHTFSALQRRFLSKKCDTSKIFDECKAIVGVQNVSTSQAMREQHGRDESFSKMPAPPDLVVFPESTDQVSHLVKVCYNAKIPMIPFGTGTGLEAGVAALQVKAVYPEDFTCVVEPGVTRLALNSHLRDTGLWFPVDPGADASLCGMTATGASGTNAVCYGTMKENVLNLEVVLADGTVIHTQGKDRRAKKTSAGYNLTNLFIGSEGTLGMITQATLKLFGIPEMMLSAVCQFPSVKSAVDTTVQCLQGGISFARIELLDELMMDLTIKYSKLDGYEIMPSLFLEFHGSESVTEEQVKLVEEVAISNGSTSFMWAKDPDARAKLWKARHDVLYACLASRPGSKVKSTDVCVPISLLPEAIQRTRQLLAKSRFQAPIVGHVGDGNFHVVIIMDPESTDEISELYQLTKDIGQIALDLHGTCTGEHGIGCGKIDLLKQEVGDDCYKVMKSVKAALDPHCLMNPGKVVV